MAKTLISICFTTLLLVVLLISAEIPKSEAQQCDKFIGEGPEGTVSNPCTVNECIASCKVLFPKTSCGGECEIHDNEDHCHCLGWGKCDKFIGEGPEGTVSNPCKTNECSASCKVLFPKSCGGECEIHDNEDHCHCLGY